MKPALRIITDPKINIGKIDVVKILHILDCGKKNKINQNNQSTLNTQLS